MTCFHLKKLQVATLLFTNPAKTARFVDFVLGMESAITRRTSGGTAPARNPCACWQPAARNPPTTPNCPPRYAPPGVGVDRKGRGDGARPIYLVHHGARRAGQGLHSRPYAAHLGGWPWQQACGFVAARGESLARRGRRKRRPRARDRCDQRPHRLRSAASEIFEARPVGSGTGAARVVKTVRCRQCHHPTRRGHSRSLRER